MGEDSLEIKYEEEEQDGGNFSRMPKGYSSGKDAEYRETFYLWVQCRNRRRSCDDQYEVEKENPWLFKSDQSSQKTSTSEEKRASGTDSAPFQIPEWWAVLPIRIKKEFHEAIEHALIVRCMNLENPSEPYHCDYLDYTYYHRGTSKRSSRSVMTSKSSELPLTTKQSSIESTSSMDPTVVSSASSVSGSTRTHRSIRSKDTHEASNSARRPSEDVYQQTQKPHRSDPDVEVDPVSEPNKNPNQKPKESVTSYPSDLNVVEDKGCPPEEHLHQEEPVRYHCTDPHVGTPCPLDEFHCETRGQYHCEDPCGAITPLYNNDHLLHEDPHRDPYELRCNAPQAATGTTRQSIDHPNHQKAIDSHHSDLRKTSGPAKTQSGHFSIVSSGSSGHSSMQMTKEMNADTTSQSLYGEYSRMSVIPGATSRSHGSRLSKDSVFSHSMTESLHS